MLRDYSVLKLQSNRDKHKLDNLKSKIKSILNIKNSRFYKKTNFRVRFLTFL
nr:MAG TPA: hypothetical protein [Caudoviricetes sp.]